MNMAERVAKKFELGIDISLVISLEEIGSYF